MNKKIVVLAVAGLSTVAAVAHAQSSVTIYGVLDVGYIKDTGRSLRLGDNDNNRMGYRGVEDLGNGLKALFHLESRFDLNDGSAGNSNTANFKGTAKSANQKSWDGAASVGLAGRQWGQIRFGRINELTTETIRKFDPFNQIGVASQIYSVQRNARIDNTARYDSPNWSGFSFGTSYSLGGNKKVPNESVPHQLGADNDGYGINLSYNGPFSATANWSRVADSNDSHVWNLGASYKLLESVKVSLSYEDTKSKGWRGGNGPGTAHSNALQARERNLLLGLVWKNVGPGWINASAQYNRLSDAPSVAGSKDKTKDSYKYGIGYIYPFSKRTEIYAIVAYGDYRDKATSAFYNGLPRDHVTSGQLGITHRF